jgi:hypothetical protein
VTARTGAHHELASRSRIGVPCSGQGRLGTCHENDRTGK